MSSIFSRLKHGARSASAGRRSGRKGARLQRGARCALLENLESRTLLTTVPSGAVAVLNRSTITGWALNVDDGGSAINVEISINGIVSTVQAGLNNPSIPASRGSPFHGFSFTMPDNLTPGKSKVVITAVSPTTGARKVLKSGKVSNPLPIGKVQTVSANEIIGWAFDADSAAPAQVRIDIDGVQGTPFPTDVARTDLSKKYHVDNLGFDVTGDFAGHVIEVYALDAPTGDPVLIYSNNRLPKGKVEVNNGLTVSGYAQDPNNPAASINVRVDIDGVTLTTVPASGERDDLTGLLGSANHGFSVTIPGLTPGKHTIAVYAIDGQAGAALPVLLQKKTVLNGVPQGHVDSISTTLLKGWALDPDLGTSPATVNVYVDDVLTFTATADQTWAKLSKPGHGFSVDLSSLSPGSHSITVTVVDNRTSDQNEVVIYDDFINDVRPTGAVLALTGTTLSGWAYDPDFVSTTGAGGANPIDVDLYVDGVYAATVSADEPSPGQDEALGSANHGWTFQLPSLPFGTHRLDVYAAESQGNVSILIGTRSVVNTRPIGAVDPGTRTVLTGWVADPDRLGESLAIKVYINGELYLPNAELDYTAQATSGRDDLIDDPRLAGAPEFTNYGFSVNLEGLAPGANQIDLFAVDLNNGMVSPIGSKIITI
jgi:hypothetical protein